ncbi:MAG: lysophospholipid acyltransferase family protein [Pyrinomonadaceae bacterium]
MAKKSKNLIEIEYLAARAAFAIMAQLPRRVAVRVSIWIMRVVSVVIKSLRRTGMTNLEIAFPEKTVAERQIILKGTFENLGRVLGELSQVAKYSRDDLAKIIDFEFDDKTKAVYARNKTEGRGVLITTGHLGNWELLVLGFAALYEPISYLARPLDNPKIDDMLNERRTRFGNNPINKTHSAMTAIKILRQGGILGILSDVNAHPKEGVFVPYFGLSASTASGAAMLAIRSNSLIYPMFCVWDAASRRYKIVHGALLEPANTGDRKRDIVETTALFTAEIEKVVRAYPDQWMWIHRRWKTRPPGEKRIY